MPQAVAKNPPSDRPQPPLTAPNAPPPVVLTGHKVAPHLTALGAWGCSGA